MPVATATADPPLEPPGVRDVFHGFSVAPYTAGSGVTEPTDEVVRVVRPVVVVLQETHALVVRLAFHRAHDVLEQRRDPAERPVGEVGRRGLVSGAVETRMDDRVQLRIELLDAVDRRVDQLQRRQLPGADELGLGGRVEERQIIGHTSDATATPSARSNIRRRARAVAGTALRS
jgi:hypothetical protein